MTKKNDISTPVANYYQIWAACPKPYFCLGKLLIVYSPYAHLYKVNRSHRQK